MTLPVFSFDTETHLIRPGIAAPPVVCMQFSLDRQRKDIVHVKDPAFKRIIVWALQNALMNGHSLAYDMCVLCAWDPELIGLIFQAYRENRATCTKMRMVLLDIAKGWYKGRPGRAPWGYHLNECVLRLTDGTYGIPSWPTPRVLDKTDPWRLRYGELYNTPVDQWPHEAKQYAGLDVDAQETVFFGQEEAAAPQGGAYLLDQFRQSFAAFWFRLMECRGIRTDPVQVEKYHAATLVECERDRQVAMEAGLVRHNGTKDTKAAMARMASIMRALDEDLPLTDTGRDVQLAMAKEAGVPVSAWQVYETFKESKGGYVKVDEDACLASGDEVLLAYQRYGSSKTILSRVERLRHGFHLPLQSSFEPLIATGRSSCRMGDVDDGVSPPAWGTQLQNMPRKEGVRECFIARPGNWGGAEECPSCGVAHQGTFPPPGQLGPWCSTLDLASALAASLARPKES